MLALLTRLSLRMLLFSSDNLFPGWIVLAFHLNRIHAVYQLPVAIFAKGGLVSLIRRTRSPLHRARFPGHVWTSVLLIRSFFVGLVIDIAYLLTWIWTISIPQLPPSLPNTRQKINDPISLLADISFRSRYSLLYLIATY